MDTRLTIVEPSTSPILEAAGLRCYEDFVSVEHGEIVAHSLTTQTRRLTVRCEGVTHSAYLKVYRYGVGHRRPWFVRDKASIEAENYRLLRDRCGVATPVVMACGSQRRGPWLHDAFILTQAVADAVPLSEYVRLRCQVRDSQTAARRRRLSQHSADTIAGMHAAGFFHFDLQWQNILVREVRAGTPGVYLIDCTRGGFRRSRLRRWHGRVRDLSSLYKFARTMLPRTEQIRWLRRYLGVRRLRPGDRVLVQAILYDRDTKSV